MYETTRQQGLAVDLFINNACFGTHDPFETLAPGRDREEVMFNVAAVVDLAHAFPPDMAARGPGAVINVASAAAFQAVPQMAVYGASKAFVLSFNEALWVEHRRTGILVPALCPGAAATT